MKEDPATAVPNNWGDPLLCYEFGMRYGIAPEFEYDTLVVPQIMEEYEYETTVGPSATLRTMTGYRFINTAYVGQPCTVSFLLWNHGGDGVETVRAMEGDTVLAEKVMAVNGDSWRVVELDIVFETAGEHTITIGDLSATITVQ